MILVFMTESNFFPNASAWPKAYTALSAHEFLNLFSYSAGERYRNNGSLVLFSLSIL